MKRVLMICYYFPPLGMGGTQRPAKFSRYLSEWGWQPTVLTVRPIAYWAQDPGTLEELGHVRIERTESWDPQRLLVRFRGVPAEPATGSGGSGGLAGWINRRVLPWLFVPDSKRLWAPHALRHARNLIRNQGFDAIYSTSPPHSVHLLAARLARESGLPWLADFRDRWAGGVVTREPSILHRLWNERLQRRVAREADALVAVTPGLQRILREQTTTPVYTLPNGYDDADFAEAESGGSRDERFRFCHCGSLSRFSDPAPLLSGIQRLLEREPGLGSRIVFDFVGYDTLGTVADRIVQRGLEEVVRLQGYKPHREALTDLMQADALVLSAWGEPDDTFIPGKTFEYMASRKPILALTRVNDTRELLHTYAAAFITGSRDPDAIADRILDVMKKGPKIRVSPEQVAEYSRRNQTRALARILDQLDTGGSAQPMIYT